MEMTYEFFIRLFLASFFTFVALFYSLRLLLADKHIKRLFIGSRGSSHWVGHMSFRIFRILIWGVCAGRLLAPSLDRYLLVFPQLQLIWLNLAGVVMMVAGFCLAVGGHANLGAQWRSGIDPDGPAELVTAKLYALSRNPMYLGVIVAQAGFFIALPSLFTLICLMVGAVAIVNQVKLEETHLDRRFTARYDAYRDSVRRWI